MRWDIICLDLEKFPRMNVSFSPVSFSPVSHEYESMMDFFFFFFLPFVSGRGTGIL